MPNHASSDIARLRIRIKHQLCQRGIKIQCMPRNDDRRIAPLARQHDITKLMCMPVTHNIFHVPYFFSLRGDDRTALQQAGSTRVTRENPGKMRGGSPLRQLCRFTSARNRTHDAWISVGALLMESAVKQRGLRQTPT